MFFSDRAAMFLATGAYAGRFPMAPGTLGSLVALPLIYALSKLSWQVGIIIIVCLAIVAVWATGEAERQLKAKDPGCIVIDEMVGMAIALIGIPLSWGTGVAGFVLFRIFDIAKPPPVRQVERGLSGGWGIVMDDIVAGIMTNIILRMGLFLLKSI